MVLDYVVPTPKGTSWGMTPPLKINHWIHQLQYLFEPQWLWRCVQVWVEHAWTWAAFPRSWCTRRPCWARPCRTRASSAGSLTRQVRAQSTGRGGRGGGTSQRLALVNGRRALWHVARHFPRVRWWPFWMSTVKHNWETMKTAVNNYIGSLNWGYRVALRDKNVNYVNAYAEFIEPHKIKVSALVLLESLQCNTHTHTPNTAYGEHNTVRTSVTLPRLQLFINLFKLSAVKSRRASCGADYQHYCPMWSQVALKLSRTRSPGPSGQDGTVLLCVPCGVRINSVCSVCWQATNKRGKETFYTAAKFVLATGERPRYLGIPGDKEYCITRYQSVRWRLTPRVWRNMRFLLRSTQCGVSNEHSQWWSSSRLSFSLKLSVCVM